jgi:hypothetical protein
MEKSSKRGKIPQQDWPSIISRYESGETLASIARTYDCSPPAISYIVSRTRARSAAAEAAAHTTALTVAEPQLLKAPAVEVSTDHIPAGEMLHGKPPLADARELGDSLAEPRLIERSAAAPQPSEPGLFPDEPPPARNLHANPAASAGNGGMPRYGQAQRVEPNPAGNGNGNAPPRGPATVGPAHNGEARRTLHLSLPQGNGGHHGHDSLPQSAPTSNAALANPGGGDSLTVRATGGQSGFAQPARQGPTGHHPPSAFSAMPAPGNTVPIRPPAEGQHGKPGGAFIDRALRERVDGDIAVFLAAFDAALDHDTSESRTELREATDRLLRAGARTRIELERLEARAPLPARDKIGQPAPLFRQR